MISYNIEIQYPMTIEGSSTVSLQQQFGGAVLDQFDHFKWWQYRTLQLQILGAKTTFTVMTSDNNYTIRFTLLNQNIGEEIELAMDSDLEVFFEKKDLFGLLTRKVKQYVGFEKLSLIEARSYLKLFLQQDLTTLEEIYRENLEYISNV